MIVLSDEKSLSKGCVIPRPARLARISVTEFAYPYIPISLGLNDRMIHEPMTKLFM